MAGSAQIKITGNVTEALAALDTLGIKAEEVGKKAGTAFSSSASSGPSAFAKAGAEMALGLAGVGAVTVKLAGDFQQSMTQLVTGAGESKAAIAGVSQSILDMAPQVGETTQQLASGMYMIESAGFHGANGLAVLRAAAEGAKVGGADLGTVADGVTTILNDYGLKGSEAATVTSKLVATVASGKTHMQDLATALAAVMPAASSAHVGMDQVLGAMATMTSKGTPAADAATYLRQTILQLSNPTAKAALEMKNLGLSAIDISSHLGSRGLTGTFDILTKAIESHMGPAGAVLIEHLKKASSSTTTFQQVLANLPPAQQTYVGALADMVGGTKSMQAALELTGDSAGTFAANVKKISDTTADAKGHVQGWSDVQKDFNFQLDQAKARAETLGIKVGDALIPKVEDLIRATSTVVDWFEKHQAVAEALAGVIGGVLSVAVGAFAVNKVAGLVSSVKDAAKALSDLESTVVRVATTVLQKFGLIGQGAQGMQSTVSAETTAVDGELAGMGGEAGAAGSAVAGMATEVETSTTTMAGTVGTETAAVDADFATMTATAASDAAAVEASASAASAAAAGLLGAAGIVAPLAAGYATLRASGQGEDQILNKMSPNELAAYTSFIASGNKIQPSVFEKNYWPALSGTSSGPAHSQTPGSEVMFPGHRARGGPVYPGRPYIVGENGPELFMPGSAGTIMPNGGSGRTGGGSAVGSPINLQVYTNDVDTQQLVREIQFELRPYLASAGF